ncbi:hypothetical protein CBW65_07545 [Tumebacillus avium]|uniref:Uncharacterized protein n=1 Tax=Tumebacillus avium TaxID=1903704 RepID=A0A1Y0INQ6_9BACL|nr:hypothetical protein [Tumebacillus avium]ARU60954.1 hypothetical protein CBW65_07545 [Tumebacillus avium]
MSLKKVVPAILGLSLVFSGSALAANPQVTGIENDTSVNILSNTPDDLSFSPGKSVKNKEKYLESVEKYWKKSPQTIGTEALVQPVLSDQDDLTHNGSNMYSKFTSNVNNGWTNVSVSGSSRAAWVGSNPFNADSITLADKITYSGVNVTISVPGSSSWSISAFTASWSAKVSNDWDIDHTYSNINSTGYDVYIKQTTTGDFKFGSSFYTTTASDGAWL